MIYLILYLISIMLMMSIVFWLTVQIAGMRYSLYECIIRRLFWNDCDCWNWLAQNKHYIWYHILILALIGTGLTNTGQLMELEIFTRPLFISLVSPILWLAFLFVLIEISKKEVTT